MEQKKKLIKNPKLDNALANFINWILPVSLIIFTFIILFFSISEQIGNMKVVISDLQKEVKTLKQGNVTNSFEIKKTDVPIKTNISQTYKSTDNKFANIKTSIERLNINGDYIWLYSLDSSEKLPIQPQISNYQSTIFISYNSSETTNNLNKILNFYNFDQSNKRIIYNGNNYSKVIVSVNSEIVLYENFDENDNVSLENLLSRFRTDKNLSKELSDLVNNLK